MAVHGSTSSIWGKEKIATQPIPMYRAALAQRGRRRVKTALAAPATASVQMTPSTVPRSQPGGAPPSPPAADVVDGAHRVELDESDAEDEQRDQAHGVVVRLPCEKP